MTRRRLLVLVSPEGDAMHRDVAEHCAALHEEYETFALVPPAARERFAFLGDGVEGWRPGGIIGMGASISKLRRRAQRFAPEIVHAHGFPAVAVALGTFPASFAARTLATFHDPQRDKEVPQKLADRRFPRYLRRAGAVVATYPSLARALERRFALDDGAVEVIPHGVTIGSEGPPLARPSVRTGPIVGWRGTLSADSAWENAIDGVRLVRERFPEARLELAGTGPARQFVAAQIRARKLSDAVTLRGDLSAADLFATIDLLVVPISRDAQPHAVLEALCAGIPVVASNGGALADAVSAFETGWLVDDDPEGLLAGVCDAWPRIDEAWRGAAEQRAAARALYARDVVSGRYRERYEAIVAAPTLASATASGGS